MIKRRIKRITAFAILPLVTLALAACEREKREFRPSPPVAASETNVRETTLQPGPVVPVPEAKNEYEQNAYAMSEGKRLFENYNCAGCHAHGGGDIGPPLMDAKWRYGSDPGAIFTSIAHGRPNGMPAFGEHVPEDQIWQLVAYVRSMSGNVDKNAAPGRTDHMKGKPPENSQPTQPAKDAGLVSDNIGAQDVSP